MPAIKTNKNNPKKALPRAPSFLSQHSIPQILPQILLYYTTAYYQCLKSGGKTQKTNTTTVEITKQGGKAVKLKKKKKTWFHWGESQVNYIKWLHYLVLMSSSIRSFLFCFALFGLAQNVNCAFNIITQNGTSKFFCRFTLFHFPGSQEISVVNGVR